MTPFLTNKQILLGVTGSIAAYKSAELTRRLREVGAIVRVVMTENAKRFITPLTMQAVSGYPVHDELFDLQAEAAMGHIELARWADAIVIAPASANFIGNLVTGQANDLLSTLCLATPAPILLAPAMNQGMWRHPSTQINLSALQKRGIHLLDVTEGSQACGDVGPGRMLEPLEIREKLSDLFASGKLAGLQVLITAGPTHEAIDPVRYITNGSSGKMGYALAEAASEAGARVTLISGPVSLAQPKQVDFISVVSALEMHEVTMKKVLECDIFIGVAAVGDYRCQSIAKQKIHKNENNLQLFLEPNPDIIDEIGRLSHPPFIVGFAAETEDVVTQAKAKRNRKRMDVIIANQVGENLGMGNDENKVTFIGRNCEIAFPRMSKHHLARQLISRIAQEFNHGEKPQ